MPHLVVSRNKGDLLAGPDDTLTIPASGSRLCRAAFRVRLLHCYMLEVLQGV